VTLKTIVIASQNPVKIKAALHGFGKMFPGEEFVTRGVSVPSGVSMQPMSDAETLQGALNRASGARELIPQADFWVGIEGGIEEHESDLVAFAWIVVCANGMTGKGRSAAFFLPRSISELVRQGKELGEADDIIFERANSKQANGAIGILTGNVVDRADLYEMAVILALVPFRNQELYKS
jgi:inosine/xanthosine triphosphatase